MKIFADKRPAPEYELPGLDVPGGHGAPAHHVPGGHGEGETAALLLVQRLVLGRAEAEQGCMEHSTGAQCASLLMIDCFINSA